MWSDLSLHTRVVFWCWSLLWDVTWKTNALYGLKHIYSNCICGWFMGDPESPVKEDAFANISSILENFSLKKTFWYSSRITWNVVGNTALVRSFTVKKVIRAFYSISSAEETLILSRKGTALVKSRYDKIKFSFKTMTGSFLFEAKWIAWAKINLVLPRPGAILKNLQGIFSLLHMIFMYISCAKWGSI